MQSVLSKASKADVVTDPYPHVVIENALDEPLYDALCEAFPGPEFFVGNELALANTKFTRSTEVCVESGLIDPIIKDFMRHHTSGAFYREVVGLFEDQIRELYPDLEATIGQSLEDMRTGLRTPAYQVADMGHPIDVVLDCQVCADYTFTARPFRGPHVDSGLEIYAGLLYLRDKDDESTGGSLGIWRAKDETRTFPAPQTIHFDNEKAVLDLDDVEQVGEVPYKANTLVMFINSWALDPLRSDPFRHRLPASSFQHHRRDRPLPRAQSVSCRQAGPSHATGRAQKLLPARHRAARPGAGQGRWLRGRPRDGRPRSELRVRGLSCGSE